MTRVAAKEFAKYGIRANAVICGFTHTPMTEVVPDKVKSMVMQQIALKRFAEPEGNFFLALLSLMVSFFEGFMLSSRNVKKNQF